MLETRISYIFTLKCFVPKAIRIRAPIRKLFSTVCSLKRVSAGTKTPETPLLMAEKVDEHYDIPKRDPEYNSFKRVVILDDHKRASFTLYE
jgi:hypothetical protein